MRTLFLGIIALVVGFFFASFVLVIIAAIVVVLFVFGAVTRWVNTRENINTVEHYVVSEDEYEVETFINPN